MPNGELKLSPYRWVIEALYLVMLLVQVIAWLSPAPILAPMIHSLGMTLGEAGLIISIFALCIGIFSFCGALIAERLGLVRTLLLGLWLLAIGEIASGYMTTFATLLACRIVEGVGYGIIIGPPAALVMQWFGEHEWPWINMVNSVFAYVGIFAVYAITPVLFHHLGSSWNSVLIWYGVAAAGAAILWTVLGRERRVPGPVSNEPVERVSYLGEVLKIHGVWLMAIALFGGLWVFQLYTAFLPEYFRVERGLSLDAAAHLTAVLPFAAMFAAALGGIGTAILGVRRPFLWVSAIISLIGCIGAVMLPEVGAIQASLVLVGIGAAGGLAATGTLMMELPGMTPAKLGTAFAFVWAVGYIGAFISPVLGGAIAPVIGLRTVMFSFLVFQIVMIGATLMLPETGPGRRRQVTLATAAAGGGR